MTPFCPLAFWSFGPAPLFLCTSSSSLVSLQPSVFVLLTHSIEHPTVVSCVCSGKWGASCGVLMTGCSNDSSLRRDLQRMPLWESQVWQILAIRMQNGGAGKGHPWFCSRNREIVEECHSLLARIRQNTGMHKRKSNEDWSNFLAWVERWYHKGEFQHANRTVSRSRVRLLPSFSLICAIHDTLWMISLNFAYVLG